VPNIIGIKEATGNLQRGREVLALASATFAVYSGDDATAVELILAGAQGNISVTANVRPDVMALVCRLALEGKAAEARTLDATVADLHRDLFLEGNPVPVKWALNRMGKIGPTLRLPLVDLDPKFHDTLHATLKRTGAL
jgi:4-hydroxy-tetrahydrodipicolinate synthase